MSAKTNRRNFRVDPHVTEELADLVGGLGFVDTQLMLAASVKAQVKILRKIKGIRLTVERNKARLVKMKRNKHYTMKATGQAKKRPGER